MPLQIKRWDVERDGALSETAMRRKLEALGYSVQRYVYPPGTVFGDHDHPVDKIDGVLAGRFQMMMHGQSVILEAGDMLVVPRGVMHRAEVVGDDPVLSLDAVRR